MFSGLDRYKFDRYNLVSSGNRVATNRYGHSTPRTPETASVVDISSRETASISVSQSSYGGLTDEDISLNYIGGSSSKKGAGSNSSVPQQVYKWYDAIFREDSICGAAIELRANIPYGGFTIGGLQKAKLQKYEEAIDNMRLREVMKRVAIERDVMGSFFGMLDWNKENKTYDSMLPYSRQHISNIIYSPVYGMDPVVDIELSGMLRDAIETTDSRAENIKKCIPNFLKNNANGARGIPVPMDSVVWVDRPHTDPRFNSMLHRILPIFLIERAITRGTIESAQRRQRGIAHITVGMGDQWLASEEELASISDLFTNADADPIGATVVTREGINYNEVRQPTDFWRITDSYDQTVNFKLRAMGLSESFLSESSTFNNQEVAISTFLQTIKAERSQVEDQLLYRKIFLQIAEANDFKRARMGRETSQLELFPTLAELAASANSINDVSLYEIPTVTWKQSLMPEGDQQYIELLNVLTERGVPPPIRTMFAAGGLDFDTVMDNSNQDIADRKRLTKYIEAIRDASPEPEQQEGQEFADLRPVGGEVGLLHRDYGDSMELYSEYSDGRRSRPTTAKGKAYLNEKFNKVVAEAISRIAEAHNDRVRAEESEAE